MTGELSRFLPDERISAAMAGHLGDEATARAALGSPDAATRVLALGALDRLGRLEPDELAASIDDPALVVARRAIELAASHPTVPIAHRLDDADGLVVEMTAWSLGERADPDPDPDMIESLARVATDHTDALCREAAVAAFGAIGDPGGLSVVLGALDDVATVRRRAVIALAAFEGPEVERALQNALDDRDWQVRQAAEDLLDT